MSLSLVLSKSFSDFLKYGWYFDYFCWLFVLNCLLSIEIMGEKDDMFTRLRLGCDFSGLLIKI